jgi:hypothetical protein
MFKYKVKVIGIAWVDWQSLTAELFGGAVTVWSSYGGQDGEFHFEEQPTVEDLGKLVRVEQIP